MSSTILKTKKGRYFFAFTIIACLVGVSYPFFNKYYIKPRKWKQNLYEISIKNFKGVNKENIHNFSECVFEKFNIRYSGVDNFPTEEIYTKNDKCDIYQCMVDFIVADSLKDYYRNNMDLIIKTAEEKKRRNN